MSDRDMDGNTAQIRIIAEHIATAFEERRGGFQEAMESLKRELDSRIDTKIDSAVTKMKFWVMSAVVTQIVAILPVIFFLGGIYSTNSSALDLLKKQQVVLEKRGEWMNERERWEQSVEQWAEPKGYTPPRYRQGAPGL